MLKRSSERALLGLAIGAAGAAAGLATWFRRRRRPFEELTKVELYRRAQAADIEGRSKMTKDELAQALEAKGNG
jgi:hypothetical protein